jgi:UDP-N-acetylmuramate dehydrogenase
MSSDSAPLFQEHVPLHDKNSYQIGGTARWYVAPQNELQLAEALRRARREDWPVFIIGKGTNLLISDQGWKGLIIHYADLQGQENIRWNGNNVTVSGQTILNAVVKSAADHGCAGMEELAGIPGTVGGAVVMNAGAFSNCIADTLESVTCCSPVDGAPITRPASELLLGYRSSLLQKTGEIVTRACFAFSRSEDPILLDQKRREILDRRRRKQPLDFPNCGSVFKRPAGNFAGTLIEQCGLKGLKYGGAEVSTKHANFIINCGNALASDVRHLIHDVQKRVFEQTGIPLEPEVIFVGDFDEPLFSPSEGKA